MTEIEHIFFDLDHTLWDFDRNSRETLAELFDIHDIANRSRAQTPEQFIDRYLFHNDRYWALYRENRISKSRLRKARFEAALQDFGVQDKAFAKKLGNEYIDLCPHKPHLNEGALETVEKLARQFTLHIITNGFEEIQATKLEVTGLSPYFDEVITSERAQAKKPNPRIFEFAETVSSAAKAHSLMIGDSYDIDVQGALDFGWKALHYTTEPIDESISISKLAELDSLLL